MFVHYELGEICVCVYSDPGFGLNVDTADETNQGKLVRFVLRGARLKSHEFSKVQTRELFCATNLLILHRDPHNPTHFVGSSKIPEVSEIEGISLDWVEPNQNQIDEEAVVTAASLAEESADREAWRQWVSLQFAAGRLTRETVREVYRLCGPQLLGVPWLAVQRSLTFGPSVA